MVRHLFALVLALCGFAHAAPYEFRITQEAPTGGGTFVRATPPQTTGTAGFLMYDPTTTRPVLAVPGPGLLLTSNSPTFTLTIDSSVLPPGATGAQGPQGVPGTNGTNGATGPAGPTNTLSIGTVGTTTGAPSASVTGTAPSQSLNLTLTVPSVSAFNYGYPTTRTLAVNTSYQATDPSKAAVITPSYACQNATQVLASSACTLQVRMASSAVTCSTGTVVYTQSLTVALGVLLTQNSTNPVPIHLPAGGHFIICPSAGTFTISTVEQVAG